MSVISNNQLAGAAGQGGDAYEIQRSLRFNSGDSAYLNRTPSSAGNRKTWTWSGWVKRSTSSANLAIWGVRGSSAAEGESFVMQFGGYGADTDALIIGYGNAAWKITNQVFRDFGAWYHFVVAFDSTQSTGANRLKLYVNGTQVTSFSTDTAPTLNLDAAVNNSVGHRIGSYFSGSPQYFNGYLADIHFIDGQALAPTDFGQFDSNNIWQPKEYDGTYGTNGFHLDFSNPSNLGNDAAGSNNWTPNNLAGTAPGLSTANQGFDAVTYTGNGGTQSITGLSFQPDFVWTSVRDQTGYDKYMVDSVRGSTKVLVSHKTDTESTQSTGVTGFTSNGFNLGSNAQVNENGRSMVAWCWKAGGSASSNDSGSIQSSVSANNTYGFSIVTWTGNGSSNQSVGHGLSTAPSLVVIKCRSTATSWHTYVRSLDSTGRHQLYLNTTAASADFGSPFFDADSSKINLYGGTSVGINGNNSTYVAYCWSEVSGFSKFSSYTGTGSNGNFVTTGFKPRFVLLKATSSNTGWYLFDGARGANILEPNSNGAEYSSTGCVFGNNGFTINGSGSDINASGNTYIYAAFADKPDQSIIDSLIDTPTDVENDSGNNGGNYCTLNPLDSTLGTRLSDGNLQAVGNDNWATGHTRGTFGLTSGKWYWEVTKIAGGAYAQIGFCNRAFDFSTVYGSLPADSWTLAFHNGTEILRPAGGGANYFSGGAMAVGDVLGIALDMDNKTAIFYKNGTAGATISLSSTKTSSTDNIDEIFPLVGVYSLTAAFNGGQRPFAYTPPTGYKSLCTTNLPDPTIEDGSTAMDAVLYTGNGSSQTISGLGFSPDLVWTKLRSIGFGHRIWDTVRGATKRLETHGTAAEVTESTALTAFTSDGFSVGAESNVNLNNGSLVAWAWDAGSSTVTNNSDGSITPTGLRANPSAGFSIVTYTGTEGGTFGHGLNAAPELVIVKRLNSAAAWCVWHKAIPNTQYLMLDSTAAANTYNVWGNTSPTSTVVTVSGDSYTGNLNDNYVAYCFAPVAGYSAFGSYTGNGSSDGPFVYTGFKPKWIMIKRTNSAKQWVIMDTERDSYNVSDSVLQANDTAAEWSNSENDFDILSNGFKMRNAHDSKNGNNDTYIYAAFAEHPFKSARAR